MISILKKEGQEWSIDTIVAVFIFLAAISIVLIILSLDYSTDDIDSVMIDAQRAPKALFSEEDSGVSLMTDNELDLDKLSDVSKKDYDEIRNLLGIDSEFCVFIEDMDGNILNISEIIDTGSTGVGIGSSQVILSSGIPCSNN